MVWQGWFDKRHVPVSCPLVALTKSVPPLDAPAAVTGAMKASPPPTTTPSAESPRTRRLHELLRTPMVTLLAFRVTWPATHGAGPKGLSPDPPPFRGLTQRPNND